MDKSLQTQLPTLDRVRQRAKKLKNQLKIKHSQALEQICLEYGYENWSSFQSALRENEQSRLPTPSPSLMFVESEDVDMDEDDYKSLDAERSTDLPMDNKVLVLANKKYLTRQGVEFSIFEPTLTGLKKSILDATHIVRSHFERENFHSYSAQGQGSEHRVRTSAVLIINSDEQEETTVSLYRPVTKKGDPRMWFYGLAKLASAGDQIAIIINRGKPYLINLSRVVLSQPSENLNKPNNFTSLCNDYLRDKHSVVNELLGKLRELSKQPILSLRKGDTGIGYTLETLLGIEANSSKLPDYKGIEIKAGRGVKTRTTLFAQVANWDLSPCKKSAEILNKYGYDRDEGFKLYCTISAKRENSQGLSFIYDQNSDQLQEWYRGTDLVAVWTGDVLRNRLKEKHAETFWVEAKREFIGNEEYFQLIKVIHTKTPMIGQFIPLLESGVITMDHLIKRNMKTNGASEKGPLFKMDKSNLELLFPSPVIYSLQGDNDDT